MHVQSVDLQWSQWLHRGFQRHDVQNMSVTCALLLTPYSPLMAKYQRSVCCTNAQGGVCVLHLFANPRQQWEFIHLIFDIDWLPAVCSLTANTQLSWKSKSAWQHQQPFNRLRCHSLLADGNAGLIALLCMYILHIVVNQWRLMSKIHTWTYSIVKRSIRDFLSEHN